MSKSDDTCASRKPVQTLNCQKVLENSAEAATSTKWWPETNLTEEEVLSIIDKCPNFPEEFCFPKEPMTEEEMEFPIAFVLIIHANIEQVFRLLKAIYWPQNVYCITYDKKSEIFVKKFAQKLSNCFHNILLPERHETIYWGRPGALNAAVNCLNVLHKQKLSHWQYVQILSGRDFPLKTNWEMVEIFKIFNGSNDSELKLETPFRYKYHSELVPFGQPINPKYLSKSTWTTYDAFAGHVYVNLNRRKYEAELGKQFTVYKGSFAATLSRELVRFIFEDEFPLKYLAWLQDTQNQDEQFWSTLIHNLNLNAPGNFPGRCERRLRRQKPWISRFQVWDGDSPCLGMWNHASCLFGAESLPILLQQKHLIAHKMELTYQPALIYCLDEILHNRTHRPLEEKRAALDYEFYRNLPSVKYQIMSLDEKANYCR